MFLLDRLDAKLKLPNRTNALKGRQEPFPPPDFHFVNGRPLLGPCPDGTETIVLGMGCFWGAERLLWETDGVWVTAAGYAGGYTPNPTYQEVCTGLTAHAEVVRVVFEKKQVSLAEMLEFFWEHHDPTQKMQQGKDRGTQYRSAIYTLSQTQLDAALQSRDNYQAALGDAGKGTISTEIKPLEAFFPADEYHQQYAAKNPSAACTVVGTGVCYPSST